MNQEQNNSLITLSNAGVHRGGRWLIRGVDLSIQPGEIVTLIGPNGSGKTTTAKIALGVIEPTEGSIHRRLHLNIGYVPQIFNLDWTLPLNVERFMQLTKRIPIKDVGESLELTGISHLRNAEVRLLSVGEFQRVMLARAIASKPDLIVLDEPVQGVDFNGEVAIYELIKRIRDNFKSGILLISHDLRVVMAATDQVICLNGHVCCSGTPTDVASNIAYRELFGARATPTLAVYEHTHDHTHLPDGRVRHIDGSVIEHCHPDDGGPHIKETRLTNGDPKKLSEKNETFRAR